MGKCLECAHWKPCFNGKEWDAAIASSCKYFSPDIIVGDMTNADYIRAMSDEELTEWLLFMGTVCECCAKSPECNEVPGYYKCTEGIRDWLRQPAEEDDNDG